jgi:hypothetical protein
MIVDVNSKMSYAAIDGLTLSQQFVNEIDGYIEIGTTYFPITIKDLHIGLNSWEDAEVITNTQPNFADTIQLISNNNPKLIIWEGHGVDACMDVDAPLSGSNDMTASTDRLMYVFGLLKDKGYLPITWRDVIEWRLYGKSLPKRCYCIMMDDWRIENFLKYENRIPFSKYNVKAGLATIENYKDYTKDSIIDVDGRSYTVKEVFDILEKEGWFACSHAEHNVLGDQVISTLPTLFKKCAYDGNAIGVHENVMVYPLGSYANTIGQMENSPYCIAVMTTIAEYNCLANSDYYLGRYEIGVRASIEDVLMVIK